MVLHTAGVIERGLYGCILHGVHDSTYITYVILDVVIVCVVNIVTDTIEYSAPCCCSSIFCGIGFYVSRVLSNLVIKRIRLKGIIRKVILLRMGGCDIRIDNRAVLLTCCIVHVHNLMTVSKLDGVG